MGIMPDCAMGFVVSVNALSMSASLPLCAYIDPGTGSLVLQVIIAVLLTVAYTVRLRMKRGMEMLFSLWRRGRRKGDDRASGR